MHYPLRFRNGARLSRHAPAGKLAGKMWKRFNKSLNLLVKAAAVCGTLLSTAAVSSTDPVLEWNSIMLNTTANQNPFLQARFAAITQLAVFEAVNAIDKDFEPYLAQVPSGAR
jgi:hypothetical protein